MRCRCEELRSLARRVCHLVVCGDVCRLPKSAVEAAALDSALKGSDLADLEASLAEGDVFLASLAASLPCTLMPGAQDPSTRALPQLPFHSALFQKAHRFANCKAAPNPHSLSVDGVRKTSRLQRLCKCRRNLGLAGSLNASLGLSVFGLR